jgi:flagellar basal body rod protein FlgB
MTVQTLYTAATGMEALETKLDVIANNMANINTTGFKKDRANFEDIFYRQYRLPGAQDADGTITATGIEVGLGTRVSSTQSNFKQGDLRAFDAGISRSDGRRNGGRFDYAERSEYRARSDIAPPGNRIDNGGMNVRQKDRIDDGGPAQIAPGFQRLLYIGHLAADEHQVVAGLHGAGDKAGDGRFLRHRVAGLNARRDAVEFDQRQRRFKNPPL